MAHRHWLLGRVADAAQADDILQDVFVKALREGGHFCRPGSPRAWLAVLVGVPMYTNAAGVIPIVQALVIPTKVLKVRLLATFVGVVAAGILLVGYVFNPVL